MFECVCVWTHPYGHGSVFLAGAWGWTSSHSRCTHKASLLCGCVYGPSACRRLWNSSRRIRTQTGDRLQTQSRRATTPTQPFTARSVTGFILRPTCYGCISCGCVGQIVSKPFLHMHIKQGNDVRSDVANVTTWGYFSRLLIANKGPPAMYWSVLYTVVNLFLSEAEGLTHLQWPMCLIISVSTATAKSEDTLLSSLRADSPRSPTPLWSRWHLQNVSSKQNAIQTRSAAMAKTPLTSVSSHQLCISPV